MAEFPVFDTFNAKGSLFFETQISIVGAPLI
jgi:hypothetical protein